jgi:hypothetical protein
MVEEREALGTNGAESVPENTNLAKIYQRHLQMETFGVPVAAVRLTPSISFQTKYLQ